MHSLINARKVVFKSALAQVDSRHCSDEPNRHAGPGRVPPRRCLRIFGRMPACMTRMDSTLAPALFVGMPIAAQIYRRATPAHRHERSPMGVCEKVRAGQSARSVRLSWRPSRGPHPRRTVATRACPSMRWRFGPGSLDRPEPLDSVASRYATPVKRCWPSA
jgi:hypothetical protein